MQPGVAVTGTNAVGIALRHQRHPVGRNLGDILRHTAFGQRDLPAVTSARCRYAHLHALRNGPCRIGQHETDLLREIDLPDLPLLGT